MKKAKKKGSQFVRTVNTFRRAIVSVHYIVCEYCGARRESEPDQDNTAFAIELVHMHGWRSVNLEPCCPNCKKGEKDDG